MHLMRSTFQLLICPSKYGTSFPGCSRYCSVKLVLKTYSGGSITCRKDDESGIADIILENTQKRNAVTGSMMLQLEECIEDIKTWQYGKAICISGSGNYFCSGADLSMIRDLKQKHTDSLSDMSKFMQGLLQSLMDLPLVSFACVEGKAIGGGSELAVSTDFVLCSNKATFQFPQKIMGVTTGWGGGSRLMQKVGVTNALELLLSAEEVSSQKALEVGLVHKVFAASDFHPLARSFVSRLTHTDGDVIRNFKRLAALYRNNNLLEFENLLFSTLARKESAFTADLRTKNS